MLNLPSVSSVHLSSLSLSFFPSSAFSDGSFLLLSPPASFFSLLLPLLIPSIYTLLSLPLSSALPFLPLLSHPSNASIRLLYASPRCALLLSFPRGSFSTFSGRQIFSPFLCLDLTIVLTLSRHRLQLFLFLLTFRPNLFTFSEFSPTYISHFIAILTPCRIHFLSLLLF